MKNGVFIKGNVKYLKILWNKMFNIIRNNFIKY